MKYVKHKLYFAWDYDKEEKWLNSMSARGLQLTNVGYCTYYFEDGQPGEYIYRLELMEHRSTSAEGQQYIRFLEEAGIEYIGCFDCWAYFRKKAADGAFELFSDIDSRIKYLSRVVASFALVGVFVFLTGIRNLSIYPTTGEWINLAIGIINTLLGLLMFYGIYSNYTRKRQLEREREIRE